tara:strand:- start:3298 stop:3732 length:435 start_codon:yes stop_codon:yes gene_type:complete
MTWSYSVAGLATNKKDQVRLMIGDTTAADPLLQDEEIELYLLQNTDEVIPTAIECCEAIAAEFSRQADTTNGALSIKCSQRAKAYLILADRIRDKLANYGEIFVGGATLADVNNLDDDSSLVQPDFKQRMFDIFGPSPPNIWGT